MRKYLPLIISFSFLILVIYAWDLIELPYDQTNVIVGEYSNQEYNPQNELIRFTLLIIFPLFLYLFYYLKFNRHDSFSINPQAKDYFLKKKKNYKNKNELKYFFLFYIILILIEFFSLNFNIFITHADIYHEGAFLVHPLNYLITGGLFKSTFYDYGLIANNIALFSNFLMGFYTLGSVKLTLLVLIFLNKLFLILLSKKIISFFSFNSFLKILLFIIFTSYVISLPNYYDHTSYFSPRSVLLVFFIFILGSSLVDIKYLNIKNFLTGTFSVISFLWWFDIGAYTNILIGFYVIFLIVNKENKKLLFLFLGILFSWILFFSIMPTEEIKEFFYQFKFIYLTSDYLLGIEYLKPFSENSTRWTRALIIIYMAGLMLVNFNFNKKYNFDYRTKIFVSLIFLTGAIIFKSALMRSDVNHIKYTSGLYTVSFVLICLVFLFNFLDNNLRVKEFFKKLNSTYLARFSFIFCLLLSSTFILDVKNIKNIIYFKNNIYKLITADDKFYLKKEYQLILNKYKGLSKSDSCIQVLTDDISFPYFLRKPSCTQFYNPSSQIIEGYTEEKFIEQLNKAAPNIILYKSPNNILVNFSNMSNAIKYINQKYSFFKDYNGYIFYKINKPKNKEKY
jgi:hypothetical protein